MAMVIGALMSSLLAIGAKGLGGLSREFWADVLAAGLTISTLAAICLGLFIRNGRLTAFSLNEQSVELSRRAAELLHANHLLEEEIRDRKRAEQAADSANKSLIDAIGSISDRFLLWDA